MDMTYEEYIDYINHLLLQEFVDVVCEMSDSSSTVNAMLIL